MMLPLRVQQQHGFLPQVAADLLLLLFLLLCVLQTVALSNLAIFAGSIANLMFNMPRQNPVNPGPLIDYDLLLLVSI
jgi:hypothetical protein